MNGLGRLSLGATLVFAASGLIGIETAVAQDGFLFVKSTPPGARIWIDGKETTQKTPCMLSGIAPGKHTLVLKKDGYEDAEVETTVSPGKINNQALTLNEGGGDAAGNEEAAEGEGDASIETTPAGATVWVDTVERGKSPVTVSGLSAGTHRLVAVLDGYELVEEEFAVNAGEVQRVNITLRKEGAASEEGDDTTPLAADGNDSDEIPAKIDVDCPYCKGSGKIESIGCGTCVGCGYILPNKCRDCSGTGRVTYKCAACEGVGLDAMGKPCRYCGGRGAPPCRMCKGRGKVPKPNPLASSTPTRPCIACDGAGWEQHLRCGACNGAGEKLGQSRVQGRLLYYGNVPCLSCGGDGEGPPICNGCSGRGYAGSPKRRVPCLKCQGSGHLYTPCSACRGRGYLSSR